MKLVWSFLTFTAFCSSLFAAQSPTSFLGALDIEPDLDEVVVSNADTCADFSGNWKGVCMASGVKKDEAFSLEQKGCVAIGVNAGGKKQMLPIGGEMAVSAALPGAPAMTFGGHMGSFWNSDKTALHIYAMGGGRKLDIAAAPKGGMFMQKVMLRNGKLYADIFAAANTKHIIAFCEFEKQP